MKICIDSMSKYKIDKKNVMWKSVALILSINSFAKKQEQIVCQ